LLAHHAKDCAAWFRLYCDAGYDDLEYSDHSSADLDAGCGCDDFNVGFDDFSNDCFNGGLDNFADDDFSIGFGDVSKSDFNSVFNDRFSVHNVERMYARWRRLRLAPFHIQHNASSNYTQDKHNTPFRYVTTFKTTIHRY
jgi:hypothetical protein